MKSLTSRLVLAIVAGALLTQISLAVVVLSPAKTVEPVKQFKTDQPFNQVDTVFNYWAVARTLNVGQIQQSEYSYFLSLDY